MRRLLRNPWSGSAPFCPAPRAGPAPRAVRGVWLRAALLVLLLAGTAQANRLGLLAPRANLALERGDAGAAPSGRAAPSLSSAAPAAPSLVTIGDDAYFAATDPAHGRELWESDGTRASTQLVSDINPGLGGSNPTDLTSFNGALVFVANDGRHGAELWRSDGTPAGTTLVADINPSTADGNTRSGSAVGAGIGNLTVVGDNLFFTANDGTHGTELWVYTGREVRLVKDINSGAGGSGPSWLTGVNGQLLFAADDGVHGLRLWKTDGTPVNTTMIPVVYPGGPAYPAGPAPLSAAPYVFGVNGLARAAPWLSPGAPAALARNLKPADGSSPLWLTAAGNTLFFSADHGTLGWNLWKRASPPDGLLLVADINSATGGGPRRPMFGKDTLYVRLA